MLVQLGDIKLSDEGQCFFLVQPKSCVLTSRVPMVSLKRWVRREGEAAEGEGAGKGEAKATNMRDAPGAHHSIYPFPGLLCTPLPAVQVCALRGGNSLQFAFWRWTAGIFFVSRAAHSVLVSLPGWNVPFLSFSLSCSEISTPIPLQSSVTACFIFPLSALCFDPLIRGLGFYLEDICLRCLE